MVIYLGRHTAFIMNENIVSTSKLSKRSQKKKELTTLQSGHKTRISTK